MLYPKQLYPKGGITAMQDVLDIRPMPQIPSREHIRRAYALVAVALGYFAVMAIRQIALPGLYYDEARYVNPAIGGAEASMRILGIPVMMVPYVGALKAYLFFPIFALFGVSAETIRLPTILISFLTLGVAFALARLTFRPAYSAVLVLLMAADPMFIFMSKVDYGPIVLMMFFKILALYFFFRFILTSSPRHLWSCCRWRSQDSALSYRSWLCSRALDHPVIDRQLWNVCIHRLPSGATKGCRPSGCGRLLAGHGGPWRLFFEGDPQQHSIDFNEGKGVQVFSRLAQELAQLKAMGKEVHLILNPPGGKIADPTNFIKNRFVSSPSLVVRSIPMEEHVARTGAINAKLRAVAAQAGIRVLDPAEWICSGLECPVTDATGIPTFKGSTHLRASYVEKNVRVFDDFVIPDREHATFVGGTANARYQE
jgi:SGNH domain (fused to AT3 domains)/Dolichyl-phosphate-mannose-protein mannosyltransferase